MRFDPDDIPHPPLYRDQRGCWAGDPELVAEAVERDRRAQAAMWRALKAAFGRQDTPPGRTRPSP
jgi:hypothetical protein